MKMTHAEIAKRAGISRTFVTMIKNGRRKPSDKTAERLAKATGWHWLYWRYPDKFDTDGNPIKTNATP